MIQIKPIFSDWKEVTKKEALDFARYSYKNHKQQLIELKEFLIECSELLSLDGQGTKPRVKEKIQEKIKEME